MLPTSGVEVREGLEDVSEQTSRLPFRVSAALDDAVKKISALHELHHYSEGLRRGIRVTHTDDRRVVDLMVR